MARAVTRLFLRVLSPGVANPSIARYASGKADGKEVIVFDMFSENHKKTKDTYLEMIRIFEGRDVRRRNHVEFIYAALKHMKEYGVNKDLEVYKSLLEVLPKGRFIPENFIQAEFMHYPKQQQCAVDLLEQMEDNGVMPDFEMEDILLNIFGRRGIPLRKYWRMMYWMPKFRNASPWRLPHKLPKDTVDLAKLAIERITSVDNDMKITAFRTEEIKESLDRTWIISAQCPMQTELIKKEFEYREKNKEEAKPLEVRGPFKVYIRDQVVSYFNLIAPYRPVEYPDYDPDDIRNIPKPDILGNTTLPALKPSVHEQDDGIILAVCATGTSSRDSLLSWIRLLEKHGNPVLADIPVIFTLLAPPTGIARRETQPVNVG